jgi:hypothetical protein
LGTYVVATRREARSDGLSPEQRIRDIPGVEIKGPNDPHRILIETSPQLADELRNRFGEKLIVEPVIRHDKLL